jgi:hypothetical protein
MDLKDIATLVTAASAIGGGGFALWRWVDDQRWRRVQYAQSVIKTSFEDETVTKACEVLDTTDQVVRFRDRHDPKKEREIHISDDFLINALSTFDEKTSNTSEELYVRLVLDKLFDEINTFQSHIDAGLIKLNDIRPYLEYWIKEISGNGRVHEERVAYQIYKFLRYFGYSGVLTLASDMGFPIKTGPQTS